MTTVPNGMPTLTGGAHSPTSGEACIMEYISVLAGEQWSDQPTVVNPLIALVAREVNDYSGRHRQDLLALIPRLMATGDHQITPQLTEYLANTYNVYQSPMGGVGMTVIKALIHSGRGLEVLTGLLDEYERLTGATPATITATQYKVATAKVEQEFVPIITRILAHH